MSKFVQGEGRLNAVLDKPAKIGEAVTVAGRTVTVARVLVAGTATRKQVVGLRECLTRADVARHPGRPAILGAAKIVSISMAPDLRKAVLAAVGAGIISEWLRETARAALSAKTELPREYVGAPCTGATVTFTAPLTLIDAVRAATLKSKIKTAGWWRAAIRWRLTKKKGSKR